MKYLKRVRGALYFLCCLLFLGVSVGYATTPDTTDKNRPKNLKLVHEEPDGKGNLVRIIQYNKGNMRVTETIIMPIKKKYNTYVPVNPDTINKDSVYLVINKSDYTLQVRYRKKVLRSYKATFGPNPQENKCMEGDRCTPEGWFRISGYNPRSKYHRFLRINYPNDSTYIRFKYLKEKGIIPMHARIGGDIGIHGVWKGGDDLIELGVGWTDGCIALKNKDIEELCSLVGIGTRVYIGK